MIGQARSPIQQPLEIDLMVSYMLSVDHQGDAEVLQAPLSNLRFLDLLLTFV